MPSSPLPPDPYKALGVAKDATIATIRSAHRKLVLTCHPDKFPDETIKAQKQEEFHRVQQAYELLSDDKSRERYDAQVRLAELKAEKFREEATRGPPRREEPLFSPRSPPERSYTSSNAVYEEIRPKTRYEDEPMRSYPRPAPRYDDYRPRRDYDDYDDFSPAHGSARKGGASTARAGEPRAPPTMGARDKFRAAAAKVKERDKEREAEDRRKSRDKSRRDEGTTKRQHVKIPFGGHSASEDSESEVDNWMRQSGIRTERERPRSYEDERHYPRRKHESRHSSPDRESRAEHNLRKAAEYISGTKIAPRSGGRRPSLSRATSSSRAAVQPQPPPPPPPPVPMPANVEDVTRSSGRRHAISSSKSAKSSSKKVPEIVEPPSHRRDYDQEIRRPDLKSSVTSPTILKQPARSSTMEVPRSERQKASIKRSATGPIPPKSSRMHDSGYSSPGTPEILPTKKTTYKIETESDEDGGPRFHVITPKEASSSSRRGESSPRTASYRSDRERGYGSSRHGPSRSQTLDEPSIHHRPPPLSRAATERPSRLFGEIPDSQDRAQYSKVSQSPHYTSDDIRYAGLPRRPSPPERSARDDPRSVYDGYGRRGSEGLPIRPRQTQAV